MKMFNKFISIIKNRMSNGKNLDNICTFCFDNNLKGIKRIFENPDIKLFDVPHEQILGIVFKYGHLDIAKYLLTSPYTKNFHDQPLDIPLKQASKNRGEEVVKYVLTSKDLIKNVDLNELTETVLIPACQGNNIGIIEFIMKDKEINKKVYFSAGSDFVFRLLKAGGDYELLQYLIFDLNIEKPKYMETMDSPNDNMIKNWFKARDLSKDLKKELPSTDNVRKNKPNKI